MTRTFAPRSGRFSVLRTADGRRARLQVELSIGVVAIEMTGQFARVVGGRLMDLDPFQRDLDRLPITEEGRVHVGVDGAVEMLGCRLQELAQFDPVARGDVRIGVILADRGVEADADVTSPSFGYLNDLEDGATPLSPWAMLLEQGRRAAAGDQIAGEPQGVGNAGLGAGPAGREGVLVSSPIHVGAESRLDVGPGRAVQENLGDVEGRRGHAAAERAPLVDDNRITEPKAQSSTAGPGPEGVGVGAIFFGHGPRRWAESAWLCNPGGRA